MNNKNIPLCEKGSAPTKGGSAVISGTSRRPEQSGDQSEAGRHQTTDPVPAAREGAALIAAEPTTRDGGYKWTTEMRIELWKCYKLAEGPNRGYRAKMHKWWKTRKNPRFTEQALASQITIIKKNNLLTPAQRGEDENENAHQTTEDDPENNNTNRSEDRSASGVNNYNNNEDTTNDNNNEINNNPIENNNQNSAHESPNVITQEPETAHIENEQTEENLPPEDRDLLEKLREIYKNTLESRDHEVLPPGKKTENKKLLHVTNKVDALLKFIPTNNITETNKLIYSAAKLILNILDVKLIKKEKGKKDPPWKHRIEKKIQLLRKHLSWIKEIREGRLRDEGKRYEIERKHQLLQNGTAATEEKIKQRIQANTAKIRRYEKRVKGYHQNQQFNNNQRRLYSSLREGNQTEQQRIPPPNPDETKEYWEGIWTTSKDHNKEAEWLKEIKKEKVTSNNNNFTITLTAIRKQLAKTANWKAPGADQVQGYWIKNFRSLHSRITTNLQQIITESQTPEWLTTGRTVLIIKDTALGNRVTNYRPITCLPLMWKLLTGTIYEHLYQHLEENNIIPPEQKGCRKGTRGTKDHLLIDKLILKQAKQKKKDLSMAWIDYKKAFDMVPHSWILECLELMGTPNNIVNLIKNSMEKWRTILTAEDKELCEIKIRRGIFQGDSLSPLLFIMTLIPLTTMLNKKKEGYKINKNYKINHLLYMDDLKIFAHNENEITTLVKEVQQFSQDIGMEFGINKCGVLNIKNGRVTHTDGIEVGENIIKNIETDGYKYLGILEYDNIKHEDMKAKIKREYLKRIRAILKSELNGGNTIKAINTWAIPVLRYSAGIIDWTKLEQQKIDRKTRKLMTIYHSLHPRACTARLYLKRSEGGRGLISAEEAIRTECCALGQYIKESTNPILRLAWTNNIIKENEDSKSYKERMTEEKRTEWIEKPLAGQYHRQVQEIQDKNSWNWLKRGEIKKETEGLITSAQDQALRTRVIRARIEGRGGNTKCRMCGQKDETINHITSECSKLAQKEYKRRHDKVATAVHWALCKHHKLPSTADVWYKHEPQAVVEDENTKLLWDQYIQTDQEVQARRPDIVIIRKDKEEFDIIDIAVPYDSRIIEKEREKIEKYQDLKFQMARCWKMKGKVIPIVIGALGAMPPKLDEYLKRIGCDRIHPGLIQKSVLLSSAGILRRILDT